jgi:predicted transposase/invertase (TIGR01784 family)
MLITSIREERKRFYENGKLEAKRDVAKKLLNKGTDISFIAEVTQLSEEEILKLKVKH